MFGTGITRRGVFSLSTDDTGHPREQATRMRGRGVKLKGVRELDLHGEIVMCSFRICHGLHCHMLSGSLQTADLHVLIPRQTNNCQRHPGTRCMGVLLASMAKLKACSMYEFW